MKNLMRLFHICEIVGVTSNLLYTPEKDLYQKRKRKKERKKISGKTACKLDIK